MGNNCNCGSTETNHAKTNCQRRPEPTMHKKPKNKEFNNFAREFLMFDLDIMDPFVDDEDSNMRDCEESEGHILSQSLSFDIDNDDITQYSETITKGHLSGYLRSYLRAYLQGYLKEYLRACQERQKEIEMMHPDEQFSIVIEYWFRTFNLLSLKDININTIIIEYCTEIDIRMIPIPLESSLYYEMKTAIYLTQQEYEDNLIYDLSLDDEIVDSLMNPEIPINFNYEFVLFMTTSETITGSPPDITLEDDNQCIVFQIHTEEMDDIRYFLGGINYYGFCFVINKRCQWIKQIAIKIGEDIEYINITS